MAKDDFTLDLKSERMTDLALAPKKIGILLVAIEL